MKCVRHKAVLPEMAEVAYKVAMSAMPFGPNKSSICKRDACPCGAGAAETIKHTFHECARSTSRRLWEMVLEQWGSVCDGRDQGQSVRRKNYNIRRSKPYMAR